ncbi:hypothetical protein D0C36_01445 [Mucilaginibacter conchicola]|uniref:IPT/TIG domain-containing protein n=1 Tax=Mucilaginibacter conchicola TaxID=2303333 RepID=A0A372NVT8_9SPHI|nr:IPT/TIG domain-containing protein [Mucilaginibacter conchicola]RFZ94248.1 hypothetical protein D0C36_01445 [Mucilaginibacter conchicola]
MKKTFTKILSLTMMFTILISACKKDNNVKPDPVPPKKEDKPAFNGTIDGKSFKLDKSQVKNTFYSTDGDAIKSNLTDITLDGSSSMKFFIADMKAGQVDITKKAGTSFNPGTPGVKIQANGTSPVLQTYIVYNNAGNAYYAFSGFIKMTIDEDGSFSMEWNLTFKDAAGREFTSTGSVFYAGYKTTIKPKSDIVDPTPVAATPTIENIAPTSGRAGDVISITGTNFSTTMADNVVKINGVDATIVSATATKVEVKAPANGTTGKISVKVKNSETKEGPTFTYVPAATLTAISVSHGKVGDVITLTGTNFSTVTTENEVKFGTKTAAVKSATATQLTVEVPQGVETGNITIKVKGYDVTPANGLDVKFTIDVIVVDPPVNVGAKGQAARISSGPYDFGNRAVDSKGNLYVVDENQQLVKMDYNGNVLKTFSKTEINFVTINSYKCIGLTNDQNGVVHALLYLSTWPNGQVKTYMATISSQDLVTKEFETYLYDQSIKGMEVDSKGQYYVLSENFNTPDILKVKKEATAEKYIQGGTGGAFGGRGAYAMDIDGNDNLYVVAYVKGKYTTDVPTQAAIYKIAPDATITPVISQYANGYKDGAIAEAQFNDIRSIAVSNLDLYVSDNGNFRIRKIATRTGEVTTIGGNGKEFTNGQPLYTGPLLGVNMNGSWGLLLDSKNGAIYSFRSSVQKFVF